MSGQVVNENNENSAWKCIEDCMLPEKNTHYGFHLLYLFLCYIYLLYSHRNLTFVSIFMYYAPICIDLIAVKSSSKIYNVVKTLFIIYSFMGLVISIIGLFGVIVDDGYNFAIRQSAILFSEMTISKDIVCWYLLAAIIAPVVLWVGSPSKKKCATAARLAVSKL